MNLAEYYMGRDEEYPPSPELQINAIETVRRANILLTLFGQDRSLSSGYRPPQINAIIPGAAPNSKHMTCQAVDIEDHDGVLKRWCADNLDKLEHIGLWMEDPGHTPTWVHVQIVPPHSGHRIFIP